MVMILPLWTRPGGFQQGLGCTRQIEELLERIGTLYELGIHRHFADVPDDLLRRYARRTDRPRSGYQSTAPDEFFGWINYRHWVISE